ncbi:coiled-coil domain-containing protein 40-like isoform X2 [Centruroides vittatus]|uniref:coiled-coil domain-containing protein 40-like isoform X2 n=1 Tax=Centruroides vittatus TaxID=120091 RepID=UPI00350F2635
MEEKKDSEIEISPDHPILSCFQSALKTYLQDMIEKAKLELLAKKKQLKEKQKEREDLGSRLYDEQENLASIQENLHSNNDKYYNLFCQCQNNEKILKTAKETYEKLENTLQEEKKAEVNCYNQFEKLNQQLLNIMKFSKNVSSHVSIIKTINGKTGKEKNKVAFEQLQQDLLIYQHLNTLKQIRDNIKHYKNSISIQKEEAKEMKQEITEADVEMKVVNLEYKQFLSQWKTWLFTSTKRDELLSSLKTVISENQAHIQQVKGEIKSYNSEIQKELEKNEQQNLLISQRKSDILHLSNLKENTEEDIQHILQMYILLKCSVDELENNYQKINQEVKFQEKSYHKLLEETQKRKSEMDTKEKEKLNILFKLKCNKTYKSACQNLEKLQEKIKQLTGEISVLKDEVKHVLSKIEITENDHSENEKTWFSTQCTLMNLNYQFDIARKEINNQINRIALYERKKSQIEEELECQKKENIGVEHTIQNLQNDIVRLTSNLRCKKSVHGKLTQEFSLAEQNFMDKLKQTEVEYIQMENKLNDLKHKNESCYNEIIKKEKELLLWERRMHQAEETKKSLHNHLYHELKSLRSEIHQKTLEKDNLKREQEALRQELEKSILHHAALYAKIEIRNELNKKREKKSRSPKREEYVQRNLNQIKQKLSAYEKEIYEMENEKSKAKIKAEEYRIYLARLEFKIKNKMAEIEIFNQEKYKNFKKLSLEQQKTKYYENIKKGKYLVLIHSEDVRKSERVELRRRLSELNSLSKKISEEYSEVSDVSKKINECVELTEVF